MLAFPSYLGRSGALAGLTGLSMLGLSMWGLSASAMAQRADARAPSLGADNLQLQAPDRAEAFATSCPEAPADGDNAKTYRFALQPGDQWANDPSAKSRVELIDKSVHPVDSTGRYTFDLFVPTLAQFDTPWTIVGQWHAGADYASKGGPPRGAPPLAQIFTNQGMMLRASVKSNNPRKANGLDFINLATISPFPTGRWVKFDYTIQFRNNGTGRLQLSLNGEPPIVNYEGPLGDVNLQRTFFKFGIYRRGGASNALVCVRNYTQKVVAN